MFGTKVLDIGTGAGDESLDGAPVYGTMHGTVSMGGVTVNLASRQEWGCLADESQPPRVEELPHSLLGEPGQMLAGDV